MSTAATPSAYRMPPAAIAELVDAPLPPHIHLAPTRTWILLGMPANLPPIAELARPELRLAGLRIDPAADG
ncbi:MAG: hypothetical protein HOC74_28870, partial [Gemmatimonadetes bacterium]|nr:hypothetical protein [Gemmatimonadota bacterium]